MIIDIVGNKPSFIKSSFRYKKIHENFKEKIRRKNLSINKNYYLTF